MKNSIEFADIKTEFLQSGYSVRRVSPRTIGRMIGTSSAIGVTLHDENLIMISNKLKKNIMITTLLHEMIHVFDDTAAEGDVEKLTLILSPKLTSDDRYFLSLLLEKEVSKYTVPELIDAFKMYGVTVGTSGGKASYQRFLVRDNVANLRFHANLSWLRDYLKELIATA